ncbi:UDP-N-acetylglucosamine--LPS N-acetylglucosamine transferase, partial [Candidatus Acetothermia bacterium]|nr:UDP-N-acetylglucosamine--LPS N-acetylglucosamine transferase [Candidatus Acetothermia bacterium]
YLLDHGAARWATNCEQLKIQLQHILSQPQLLKQMKRAASKLGRPAAAHTAASLLCKRYLE